MTDRYPPFRFEQGGSDPAQPTAAETSPTEEPPFEASSAAVAPTGPAPSERGRAGRIVLFVVGSVAALLAFALLVGGCALVAVDQTQRDDDGEFRTSTYALVSESADLHLGSEWAVDAFLGTVRIRSESDRAVFLGIGPARAVDAYGGRVGHRARRRVSRRSGPRAQAAEGSRRSTGSRRTATGGSS
jgi:hypothetical protein